jgi:hypothetical protein
MIHRLGQRDGYRACLFTIPARWSNATVEVPSHLREVDEGAPDAQ